ncbi:MAG: phosphoenolpyruvate synthase [Candidatus Nealsonbacteria bacterium]|nr:phosphoenolpyruvate synthase [Candidatus Nealsonbacteria bacterium]
MPEKNEKNILWFNEVGIIDVPLVGGKNGSLGEMYTQLTSKGVNVPYGFAVTVNFYWKFIKANGLDKSLPGIFKDLDASKVRSIQEVGKAARSAILSSVVPEDLKKELFSAYSELSKKYGAGNTDVAVRTSGVAEDMPNTSFAGQFETYLNITGNDNLLNAVKMCFVSFFTDRAIVYREEMKVDHLKIGLSVGVQKMVRSDVGTSGVMFSCDTESGFGDVVLINASYGLGENVVKGRVDPDQFYVFETTLKKGFKPIVEKKLGSKLVKLIYTDDPKNPTKEVSVLKSDKDRFCATEDDILSLSRWSVIIEDHYKKSMDCEWAKDGKTGELFIVQARPETVQSKKNLSVLEDYVISSDKKNKVLVEGLSVGNKIGQGKANVIKNVKDINNFNKGEVLVTDMTDPDWVPAMKLASAIVTNRGGRTCHAAIVGRELGVPTVVGTGMGTKLIKNKKEITVSCAEGETGKVYEGIIPFKIKKTDISNLGNPKVKITLNVGEPGNAFNLSFIPNDGVGLAREEFIIANNIKVHPLALLNYKKLKPALKNKIDKLTLGYKDKTQFYIDKLAEGIGKIGAAFYPKHVIVRFSDFKTNEYRSLVGGEDYEPKEENPMIGWRGASRYYDERFSPAFALECKAIKKVREVFGLDNVEVMIPFCRTVEEGKKVLKLMEENGLKRGEGGLKAHVMCEIPSNVILAEEFLDIFDGFSIGSNDLTQLTLGLDRDNAELAHIGNEKNEAVKKLINRVIRICAEKNKYLGICGDAPSTFSDFAKFLVDMGIESISLSPDAVIKTRVLLADYEGKRSKK